MNGVSTDDDANVTPNSRRSGWVAVSFRNANAAPRKMMPTAAIVSGTYSVDMIGANAVGEGGPQRDQHEDQPDVIGLPDRSDRLLDQRPRRLTVLVTARDEVPEPGAEVGAREQRVEDDPDEHHRRAHVGQLHVMSPRPAHPARRARPASGARTRRRSTTTVNTAMNA